MFGPQQMLGVALVSMPSDSASFRASLIFFAIWSATLVLSVETVEGGHSNSPMETNRRIIRKHGKFAGAIELARVLDVYSDAIVVLRKRLNRK